jgi:hypothetical protein
MRKRSGSGAAGIHERRPNERLELTPPVVVELRL